MKFNPKFFTLIRPNMDDFVRLMLIIFTIIWIEKYKLELETALRSRGKGLETCQPLNAV